MRRVLLMGVGLFAVVALAACQKKTEAAKPGEPAQAAAGAAAGSAAPVGPPKRKPGLWAQTVSTRGMTQTSKICLDAATDAKLSAWGQAVGKGACSKNAFAAVPGGWSFASQCDMGQMGKVATAGMASGDFNSRYVVKAKTVTTGASMPQANGTHEMELTATWEGPCPAGMRPGDMAMSMPGMPKGMTMNIEDTMAKK